MNTQLVIIYCPDCYGKFEVNIDGIEEDDVLECDLCMAEMEIMQTDPFRVRLFVEE